MDIENQITWTKTPNSSVTYSPWLRQYRKHYGRTETDFKADNLCFMTQKGNILVKQGILYIHLSCISRAEICIQIIFSVVQRRCSSVASMQSGAFKQRLYIQFIIVLVSSSWYPILLLHSSQVIYTKIWSALGVAYWFDYAVYMIFFKSIALIGVEWKL